jgi:tRNA pseudouridine55 synthase
MGHTGTLDPLATGCLLIATENSTKLIPLLESAEKEYIATIDFSGKSDSYDRGTTIESVDATSFRWKTDRELCTFLLSLSSQIPPRYSAIHVDGVRAYEKALS